MSTHYNKANIQAHRNKHGDVGAMMNIESSPIPSAEEVEKYSKIDTKFVDFFIKHAEQEQSMRGRMWKQIIIQESVANGFIILGLLCVLGLCFYISYLGNTNAAAWLGSAVLGGGFFLIFKKK